MKSKELKTKIYSHAHSLILSLTALFSLDQFAACASGTDSCGVPGALADAEKAKELAPDVLKVSSTPSRQIVHISANDESDPVFPRCGVALVSPLAHS